ncbi:hypothetical protein IC620_10990 [Hazenella sp. IB182357]|uniref:Bacterial toxin 35 domain-containing protein n=1 Tax=Polycladospora coralii TaxID=2771432 RepID=A0A926N6X7_9BACL|nr:hypothetical protein [Polycladospora coralii]
MHNWLDAGGFTPLGPIADGANAVIYLTEGDLGNYALSAFAMISIVGDGAKAGSKVVKYGVKKVDKDDIPDLVKNVVDGTVLKEVAEIGQNKISHIMAEKHDWHKVVSNPESWDDISIVMSKVLNEGVEVPYKGVWSKRLEINGESVLVTYAKTDRGVKVSNGWVEKN